MSFYSFYEKILIYKSIMRLIFVLYIFFDWGVVVFFIWRKGNLSLMIINKCFENRINKISL